MIKPRTMTSEARPFQKIAFVSVDKPEAKTALRTLSQKYGNVDPGEADVIVPLGGDGFMLETLRKYMPLVKHGLQVYGVNQGTIGIFDE